ncbi:MAG: thioredoxin domain-containing protein [Saprospiraceae bacterium]|nr:thioredoxin domain-containing protein [Saprospiraceae bacterium]
MSLHYLLDYYYFTGEKEALQHVDFSLKRMIQGGIYDQLGGGFARYTVDKAWLVPHFEKMLYDNALLLTVMAEAYKLTKDNLYKETIAETLQFIQREMTSDEGGFYSAQDADSEGVEGKYYVWKKAEIDAILGEDAPLFNEFYDVTAHGNWEETNILWRAKSYETFAKGKGMEVDTLKQKLAQNRQQLFTIRDQRIHPSLDDKILLDWNALTCTALAQAYMATGTIAYKEMAVRNIHFIGQKMVQPDGITLYHTYKNGQAQYDAFLNDYAFFIEALLEVYAITFDVQYLRKADVYCTLVLDQFFDKENKLFYFTSNKQQDIVLRKKDLYDGAQPSGNSTMVKNLQQLGILLDNEQYKSIAAAMLLRLQQSVQKYPTSFQDGQKDI